MEVWSFTGFGTELLASGANGIEPLRLHPHTGPASMPMASCAMRRATSEEGGF